MSKPKAREAANAHSAEATRLGASITELSAERSEIAGAAIGAAVLRRAFGGWRALDQQISTALLAFAFSAMAAMGGFAHTKRRSRKAADAARRGWATRRAKEAEQLVIEDRSSKLSRLRRSLGAVFSARSDEVANPLDR